MTAPKDALVALASYCTEHRDTVRKGDFAEGYAGAMNAVLTKIAELRTLAASAPEQAVDVEAMLVACVPGGSYCDPQQVADAIREYVTTHRPADAADSKGVGEAWTVENAPMGTRAPAVSGGYWLRVIDGWRWNASGSVFPRPGGDWTGELHVPDTPQHGGDAGSA